MMLLAMRWRFMCFLVGEKSALRRVEQDIEEIQSWMRDNGIID